ncbi:MAG TPA: VCBS repeat-containing protein [Polyangia bacterium]|nr:VCBS repeat-containing protein [Polyangia bacterium]
MLTATISDRRQTSVQLTWPVMAVSGAAPTGYDIRVARVPITATNFDDTAATITETFTGTPAAVGQADGLLVKNLNIEQDYYFAVAGKTATTRGTIMATTTATHASFLTVSLTGTGTDGLGYDVDGSGDFGRASDLSFTADGLSDLIVGAINGTHVLVFFGRSGGYATTPSITITGPTGFGQAVANAGDVDGDGLNDIAIASGQEGGGKIYIFSRKSPPASWGTTGAWPATLTSAQANYVITIDQTFAGGSNTILAGGMSRLGNFDGMGSDDLAIGLSSHGATMLGSVLIIKGSSTFASGTVPDATRAIEIDGTIAGDFFGSQVAGIGPFFTGAGPGLVTSGLTATYAFKGQSPTGTLTAASADDSLIASAAISYGFNLGFLGAVGGSAGAISIPAVTGTPSFVDLHLGTAATGPLLGPAGGAPAPSVKFTDSTVGNSFGIVNLGGGLRGTSQVVSIIGGDTVPDLVLAGQAEVGVPVYVINGAALSTFSATVDVAAAQTAVVTPIVKVSGVVPTPWAGYAGMSVIPDSNMDGYGDFALGEFAAGKAGRVVVFY